MKRFPGCVRPHIVHDHVRDEAIAWLIGFCEREFDAAGREQFERWLHASPEHVQAYLQVSALWEAAGRLNSGRRLRVDELVRRAADDATVHRLNVFRERTRGPSGKAQRRALWGIPAAVAASVVFAALWWQSSQSVVYATEVGEVRTLTLPDASTVVLDAQSKIRVRYTEETREVHLVEGQALFRVVHSVARPFVVVTDDATIQDLGTQFDVRRHEAATVVTVVEGKVATFHRSSSSKTSGTPAPAVYVAAGEQVTIDPRAPSRTVPVNASVTTAWTQGKLVFDVTPLSRVVDDFNRYSLKPLSIDDPQLLALHISGTFEARDSAQLVQFLSQRFGLIAHESNDIIRLARD